MEAAIPRAKALCWVRHRVELGDLILIGSRDPVSRVIQRASNSRFSHAAIVTGDDVVTEAYDYSLTFNEDDEGIYRTKLDAFLRRTPRMHVIKVLRPEGLDPERLRLAADGIHRQSPPYPTVGATMLGFIRLFSESVPPVEDGLFGQKRFGKRLHRGLDRLARAQVGFVGDGFHKVHCAESVVRIYHDAGFAVHLPRPFLNRSVERAKQIGEAGSKSGGQQTGSSLPEPSTRRDRASPDVRRLLKRVILRPHHVARTVFRVWKWRMDNRHAAAAGDYTFPGDLGRAKGFRLIGETPVDGSGGRIRRR